MSAITVENLVVEYGDLRAVDRLDLDIASGEVYALLGENGAGKTSTIEVLEGLRTRTSGSVRVLGHDPADASRDLRDRIGIVLQSTGVERQITVAEAVALYGAVYRRPRPVGEVLELVGLGDRAEARCGTLSGGQRRRLDLALGIVGSPELLFLDEPTTGFDPSARRRAWELVDALRSDGMTVVLTTHYLDEAEHLADRVGVMSAGRLIVEGTPADLQRRSGRTLVSFRCGGGKDELAAATRLAETLGNRVRLVDGRIELLTAEVTAALHALTSWAVEQRVDIDSWSVAQPSLEQVFLDLVGGAEGE
ncbi:MAG: ABC transporter ATP-binding protein [Ilumatobacteraceae bacterium]|nr:ABC transporter ATP-binding protein [Ilumatobacteraceae bacterium]